MLIKKVNWPSVRRGINELFLNSYGRPIAKEYLEWRYFDNEKEELLLAIEHHKNKLVASYSAFPVDLILNQVVFKTAMSMTTMTHTEWRGKGLFQKLALELYESMQNCLGVRAIWGFPNASSHATFGSKLLWSDIYEIPTLTLNLSSVDIKNISQSKQVIRDDDFSLVYPNLSRDGLIRVNRTKEYLLWRYKKNPSNEYQNFVLSQEGQVTSYVVLKTYGGDIDLVDIQTSSPDDACILLMHIIRVGYDAGVKKMYCWAPTHHYIHGVLERLGFVNDHPITYFGGRELIASSMPLDWLNYKSWYIQMGDSDVY
jgi:Acetyltransferase (GNAT) domain